MSTTSLELEPVLYFDRNGLILLGTWKLHSTMRANLVQQNKMSESRVHKTQNFSTKRHWMSSLELVLRKLVVVCRVLE